jgi:hypothetical protein
MIQLNYKGFLIVSEFNNLFDIRNSLGFLESENLNSIKECKKLIDTWI